MKSPEQPNLWRQKVAQKLPGRRGQGGALALGGGRSAGRVPVTEVSAAGQEGSKWLERQSLCPRGGRRRLRPCQPSPELRRDGHLRGCERPCGHVPTALPLTAGSGPSRGVGLPSIRPQTSSTALVSWGRGLRPRLPVRPPPLPASGAKGSVPAQSCTAGSAPQCRLPPAAPLCFSSLLLRRLGFSSDTQMFAEHAPAGPWAERLGPVSSMGPRLGAGNWGAVLTARLPGAQLGVTGERSPCKAPVSSVPARKVPSHTSSRKRFRRGHKGAAACTHRADLQPASPGGEAT